jgi:hypothetical protein
VEVEAAAERFRSVGCVVTESLCLAVWDTYLSEENGDGFMALHVYVCAAFLRHWTETLRKMEFQDLVIFLQHLPTGILLLRSSRPLGLSPFSFLCSLPANTGPLCRRQMGSEGDGGGAVASLRVQNALPQRSRPPFLAPDLPNPF